MRELNGLPAAVTQTHERSLEPAHRLRDHRATRSRYGAAAVRAAAIGVLSAAAALAIGPFASAHSNPCHSNHACPSDHHSYVWADSAGRSWDCARPGAEEYQPARDTTTIVYDQHTYHCFRVGSSSGRATAAAAATSAPARGTPPASSASATAVISRIVDGDTVDLTNGRRVRLVQIDTPEVYFGTECDGPQASAATKRLLPVGTKVKLLPDPAADSTDRYGRLLRYVVRLADGVNINVRLVSDGAAAPYFYDGQRGRFAAQLERLAQRARTERRGLWGRCPSTRYSPYSAVSSGR
jgi:micrococcal nuclease